MEMTYYDIPHQARAQAERGWEVLGCPGVAPSVDHFENGKRIDLQDHGIEYVSMRLVWSDKVGKWLIRATWP